MYIFISAPRSDGRERIHLPEFSNVIPGEKYRVCAWPISNGAEAPIVRRSSTYFQTGEIHMPSTMLHTVYCVVLDCIAL